MPKSSSKRGLVLVTGGSGYVAGYCIAQLLNDGWRVRTTVRSSAKSKAVRASIGNIASKTAEIEFVEADLNSDAGWRQAIGGAQYALHVASPVPVTTRRTMTNWSDRRATARCAYSRPRATPGSSGSP
jgi:uncharacterized protein YbjT (DUF2867 family)